MIGHSEEGHLNHESANNLIMTITRPTTSVPSRLNRIVFLTSNELTLLSTSDRDALVPFNLVTRSTGRFLKDSSRGLVGVYNS